MAEGNVNVTEGSGKRLHVWDRTISSTLVHAQFMLPDEYPYACYSVVGDNVSVATSAAHVMQIMSGSSTYTRIRRIHIMQAANATTAGLLTIECRRITSAGTGGTSVTPAKYDNGDSASSATAQTIPTSKGTESTVIWQKRMQLRQSYATFNEQILWEQLPNTKPIIIPSGTSNGIALKVVTGQAGATVDVTVEFVETAWLGA